MMFNAILFLSRKPSLNLMILPFIFLFQKTAYTANSYESSMHLFLNENAYKKMSAQDVKDMFLPQVCKNYLITFKKFGPIGLFDATSHGKTVRVDCVKKPILWKNDTSF
jgi:hypothetical protein